MKGAYRRPLLTFKSRLCKTGKMIIDPAARASERFPRRQKVPDVTQLCWTATCNEDPHLPRQRVIESKSSPVH